MTRLVLAGYPVMGLGLAILKGAADVHVGQFFACSLFTVFYRLHLWTPFVSGFYHESGSGMAFLMLLLELYMGMQYFPRRERELGSTSFLLWLMLINAAANIVFLSITAVLCVVWNPGFAMAGNAGLWPLIILNLSINMLADPNGSSNFWGIFDIPNRWYPLFFVGIFSLFNGQVLWNLFAAVAFSYAQARFPALNAERFLPSTSRVDGLEKRACFHLPGFLGGMWISASGASGSFQQVGDNRSTPAAQVWGQPMQATSMFGGGGSSKFTVFSGQGNRLGDGESDATASSQAASGTPAPPARSVELAEDEECNEAARLVTAESV